MKKIVALLICVLLIAALAIPTFAAGSATFVVTPSTTTAQKGDQITFTVSLQDAPATSLVQFVPKFDETVFKLVKTSPAEVVMPPELEEPWFVFQNSFSKKMGLYVVATVEAGDSTGVDLNGVRGTFVLEVIADCANAPIEVGASTAKTKEGNISVSAASVTITGEHSFGAWTPKGDNHAHTCSKCGAEETGAHNWNEGTVTEEPNCTQVGWKDVTCADCAMSTSVSIPTNGQHTWNAGEITTEPKCGVEGVKTYTCQHNAEHTRTESVPALEHVLPEEWTANIAATCTEPGVEHRCCELCWNPVMSTGYRVTREIPALGHTYGEWYVATEPGCETDGEKRRDCQRTGPGFDCDHFESEVIPATGHTMGDWYVVTDSTCTATGEERRDCADCDKFDTQVIEKKPHDYVNAVVTAPTCTEKGYTTRTCVCGASIVDTYVNPTGHKFEKNWQIEVAPTCTEKGEERDYCANGCGQFNTQSVPATGHTYNEGVITTAPECEKEGVKTFTCIHGDHSYTEAVPATGHTPADDAEVKEATCTEPGEMTGKCKICGKVLDKKVLPAKGHKWGEWTVTTPATCTAKGVETRECAACHETETRTIDMIDHDRVHTVTAPTCTEQGYTTVTCKNCDYNTVGEYVKATGHSFGEWVETKASTCIVKGEQRRDCANCDHFETEKLPLAEHKYVGSKVEPTCTEPGKESGKCSVCGDEVNEKEIPALGHDFGEYTVTTEPGCETEGEKTASCSRCDATDVQKIAATGHTFGDWIKVDEKNHKHVCACGHEETVAHNWDSGNVVTPATHSATGLKRFECKDCHATREEELAKLNNHDDMGGKSKPIKNDKDEPDKKYHTAVCTCGEEHKEEHSYTFIEIIEEATEGKKGKKLFRCDCGVEDIVTYRVDGTLDNEPGTGDITGQVVMTGVAAFSMMAAAAYVFIRKRTA